MAASLMIRRTIRFSRPSKRRSMLEIARNLPPKPGVFPDYPAPVVRNAGSDRKPVLMRWGMPPPPRTGGPLITNIRNVPSELRAAGALTKKST